MPTLAIRSPQSSLLARGGCKSSCSKTMYCIYHITTLQRWFKRAKCLPVLWFSPIVSNTLLADLLKYNYITLHHIISRIITSHYITLHYITLRYIARIHTYIHTYIQLHISYTSVTHQLHISYTHTHTRTHTHMDWFWKLVSLHERRRLNPCRRNTVVEQLVQQFST